jgi:hypothetical protein
VILAVVKDLANKFSKEQLNEAAASFEADRTNLLSVEGKDEGEILSNLLVAAFVRTRMDKGMAMQDAIREYSSRVRGMIAPAKK